MNTIRALALLILAVTAFAESVYVPARIDENGEFREGYWKTKPDRSLLNNYSTKGNTNPFTGEDGTVDPVAAQERKFLAPKRETPSSGLVWVDGYTRKDGTYVEGHYRRSK